MRYIPPTHLFKRGDPTSQIYRQVYSLVDIELHFPCLGIYKLESALRLGHYLLGGLVCEASCTLSTQGANSASIHISPHPVLIVGWVTLDCGTS